MILLLLNTIFFFDKIAILPKLSAKIALKPLQSTYNKGIAAKLKVKNINVTGRRFLHERRIVASITQDKLLKFSFMLNMISSVTV